VLGRDHILLAGAAGIGMMPVLDHTIINTPVELALVAIVVAGFGILPDIDEPNSTVANKLGSTTGRRSILAPITRAISHVVRFIGGGHRMFTHSILFAAITTAGIYELDLHWGNWTSAIIFFLASGLTLKTLLPLGLGKSRIIGPAVALIGGYWLWLHPVAPELLAFAAGGGVILHMVGDTLTSHGVPWLFPWRKSFAIPLVGHTASARETILGACLSLVFLGLLYLNVVQPIYQHGFGVDLPSFVGQAVTSTKALVSKGTKMTGIVSVRLPNMTQLHNGATNLESWINNHAN
jgi:membrane-bound metal-dependent hydrolase YbcI (DUF457 family)